MMRTTGRFMLCFLMMTSVAQCVLHASSSTGSQLSEAIKKIGELEFRDVKIKPAAFDGFEFNGLIRNTSRKDTLHSVTIRILFYDCAQRSVESTCKHIGERIESIYLTIPPGQEKAFKEPIYIYGDLLKKTGDFVWRYEVLSTKLRE